MLLDTLKSEIRKKSSISLMIERNIFTTIVSVFAVLWIATYPTTLPKNTVSATHTSPSCYVMSDNGESNPSLSDLLKFMKDYEDGRKNDQKIFEEKLKTEREKDKSEFANDIYNLKTTLSELVETGVKDGIELAVG